MLKVTQFVTLTLSSLLLTGLAAAQTAQSAPKAQEKAPQIEEKATDIMFPSWIKVGKGENMVRHDAVSLAVRTKTIFKVKVYAYGLYLDMKGAAPLVQPYVDKKWKDLMKDRNFEKAVLSDKFGKTLRLAMARDVDAEDMADAFDDALKPRVKTFLKKGTAEDRQKGEAAVKQFQGFFTKECEEDQVLVFTWLPGGRLLTSIDGKKMPEIKNHALCWALFDVYVGEDPISKNGKEAFVKALPKKVKALKAKQQ